MFNSLKININILIYELLLYNNNIEKSKIIKSMIKKVIVSIYLWRSDGKSSLSVVK